MVKRTREKTTHEVDFSGVESSGVTLPEGGYRFKVNGVSFKDNDDDGAFVWKLEVSGAESKKLVGKSTTLFTNLGPNSLWVLRNLLDALGIEVPDGPLDIDFKELEGLEFECDIEHREWEGKKKSNFTNFMPADGESAEGKEEEDETEVKDSRKKRRAEPEEEEDEAPKKKKRAAVEEDEDEPAPKKKRRAEPEEEDDEPAPKKKSRRAEPEDEEEEAPAKKKRPVKDEEEEDEAPAKKKKRSAEPDDTYTEDEVRGMDEKELKALIKKHDLDVDLDDFPSLRKQAIAVADALEKADLLSE